MKGNTLTFIIIHQAIRTRGIDKSLVGRNKGTKKFISV
jgi:hypothetical protein